MTRAAPQVALAARITLGGWLLGWFWKSHFLAGYLLGEGFAIPIDHGELPGWLQSPALAALLWLLPAATLPALIWPRLPLLRAAALTCLGCALTGTVHVASFSDATFVTSLWVAAWLTWLVWHGDRDDAERRAHARRLAQCTLAVIFLGPALGKLTGEYASGEAFYNLYVLQKPDWPYAWLRAHVEADTLRALATWFSRVVIAGELLLAANPVLPYRVAAALALPVMVTMVAISTVNLASVLLAPGAMVVGGLVLNNQSSKSRS